MAKNNELMEIAVTILGVTEKAVLVENLEDEEVWLPKSQIRAIGDEEFTVNEFMCIEMPNWLAKAKDLV